MTTLCDADIRPRILIVRLSALGDVIHGAPVACALREAFPQAFLAWVVEGRNGDLIEGHAALDQVIRIPRRWLKSPKQVVRIRRQLRSLQFDIAVDLQCLTKSAVVAALSGAKRRLGAAGSDGRELSKWFNNELTEVRAAHVVEHYLGILAPLEVVRPAVSFDLPEKPSDAQFALRAMAEAELTPGRAAILNPGAGWPSKIWPARRYGHVAQHLLQQHGVRSLAVWGGGDERRLAQEIVDHSGGAAALAPPTTLCQLGALLRRASLFLGSDTGPMHLAAAVGVPTISMHGTSRADWCGAYGENNIRLQAYYDHGSARQRRAADNAAMRAISIEAACNACDQLLASDRSRSCA